MRKILIQGCVAVLLIAGVLLLFSRVNWVKRLGTQKKSEDISAKLGDLIYKSIEESEKINKDPYLKKITDSLFYGLCKTNDIDTAGLKIHLVEKDMVNAFATPGGHIFIFTGLLAETGKQEELVGVIAHELAHIQLNHVMKKLITEVGLSALISLASGSGGAVVIGELVNLLSSSAYSRSLEKEADIKGADYLIKAAINTDGIADLMYKLSSQPRETDNLYWLESHPDSKERAQYLAEYCKGKVKTPVDLISKQGWEKLKDLPGRKEKD